MNRVLKIAQEQRVAAALQSLLQQTAEITDVIIKIQQIPAPTFAETKRARFVKQQFTALGLADVLMDKLGNVYGRYPGQDSTRQPVILSAHTDTVFAAETDLSLRHEPPLVYGPGIGDNSTGVAALLVLAQTLSQFEITLPADLWFVANVCEEGMGDLRGMRAVYERFGADARYVVLEGGLYGQICHQAIGVRRFQIRVEAPGGHSWGSFGATSAIHVLGRLIAAIDSLAVPQEPRTSYNVGVIEGGTTINTIAQSATLWLDLRSEEAAALQQLETDVRQLVAEIADEYEEAAVSMTLVGDRPAGQIPRSAPIVTWAETALNYVGVDDVNYMAGSTDTNIPLSHGVPAVCVGVAKSGHAHRLDEYLDTTHVGRGLGQILLLSLAAAGFAG